MEKGGRKKIHNRGMEEAPQNYKESSHSAYANGMNETGRQKILHCMIASIP